jgi:hypothetical protein
VQQSQALFPQSSLLQWVEYFFHLVRNFRIGFWCLGSAYGSR